jgi:hypothetical protein
LADNTFKLIDETNQLELWQIAQNENQQWQLEASQHETENTDEENQPLLAQHHQFIEDKAVARDNDEYHPSKELPAGKCRRAKFGWRNTPHFSSKERFWNNFWPSHSI